MRSNAAPGLLTFNPILKEKVWGGDALRRFGFEGVPGARLGEAWLLADLASTTPSGGGGEAAISVIARGPHRGESIRDLLRAHGVAVLGAAPAGDGGAFPLLVKLLDARENLSVQTHPSPAYAAAHREAHLKTETWFVLEAAPGGAIYAGLSAGVDPADLPGAAVAGRLEPLLRRLPVREGDCIHLPSGTLHALGAGVVVAEVQTPSDTTFRLDDWGRTGRELHVEQAMACLDAASRPEPTRAPDAGAGRWRLVDTEAYAIDLLRLDARDRAAIRETDRGVCALCVAGELSLETKGDRLTLGAGGLALAPAALGEVGVTAGGAGGAALVVRVGAGQAR